jgi:hypothetical protein
MKRRAVILGLPALLVVPAVQLGRADAGARPVEFDDARLKVEVNATDRDAGLQMFLDGEAWNEVELRDPSGNKILDVDVRGRVKEFGLTELFSESSEPPFDEFPIEEFKRLFPAGMYTFRGTTVEGVRMIGRARLTHNFPDGPAILSPAADERLRPDEVVMRWAPVTTPAGIDIAGYQVIVEQEDPVLRIFSADLPAKATQLTIPAEFLRRRGEYKVEVLAIEASGNQTLTEVSFRVRRAA